MKKCVVFIYLFIVFGQCDEMSGKTGRPVEFQVRFKSHFFSTLMMFMYPCDYIFSLKALQEALILHLPCIFPYFPFGVIYIHGFIASAK